MGEGQVHLSPRIRRKLVKLWYFRQELVLGALWRELRECEGVVMGGIAAKAVTKYLGTFGMIHWVRDGRGTEEQWQRYRHALREYAIRRAAVLRERIEKVESMKPPESP